MSLNETYTIVLVGKDLSDMFLLRMIWNKDASLKFLLLFTVQYATMTVQKKQECLKQNGTHRLLIYAANVNILPESIQTTKKNTEDFIVTN